MVKQFRFSKIKEFRKSAGMTQSALAKKAGFHVMQISAWECEAEKGLTVSSLAKLADALGKSTDDFFV